MIENRLNKICIAIFLLFSISVGRASPQKLLDNIYAKLKIPKDQRVVDELSHPDETRNIEISGHKFHLNVSTDWINKWKKIDNQIWRKGIKEAQISNVMHQLNYLIY